MQLVPFLAKGVKPFGLSKAKLSRNFAAPSHRLPHQLRNPLTILILSKMNTSAQTFTTRCGVFYQSPQKSQMALHLLWLHRFVEPDAVPRKEHPVPVSMHNSTPLVPSLVPPSHDAMSTKNAQFQSNTRIVTPPSLDWFAFDHRKTTRISSTLVKRLTKPSRVTSQRSHANLASR